MPRSDRPLAFEMVILGQSGGPTETGLSGYILKPYETSWTDGWVGLEGGMSKPAARDWAAELSDHHRLVRCCRFRNGCLELPSAARSSEHGFAGTNPARRFFAFFRGRASLTTTSSHSRHDSTQLWPVGEISDCTGSRGRGTRKGYVEISRRVHRIGGG